MDLHPDTVLTRNEDNFLANPVGNEIIILNMESGNYLGLNAVGSFIWEQLSEPKRLHQLLEHLQSTYDVDQETCLRETTAYIEQMNGFGLIQVVS